MSALRKTLGLLLLTGLSAFGQSQRIVLFNGKDLADWETQGPGTWTVAGGEIRGMKTATQTDWAHLVSKRTFTDGYVRVRYKVQQGNSGLYLRSRIGSEFGVTGVQVEMGGNDGSMMTVIPGEWKWLPGNPVANPQAPLRAWHEIGVEVKGQTVTSFIDGKQFMQVKDIDTALFTRKAGSIGFQLHAGNYVNELFLKDIELFLPTLIRGCMDPAYREFNRDANEADSTACKTRIPTATARLHGMARAQIPGDSRDLRGRKTPPPRSRPGSRLFCPPG